MLNEADSTELRLPLFTVGDFTNSMEKILRLIKVPAARVATEITCKVYSFNKNGLPSKAKTATQAEEKEKQRLLEEKEKERLQGLVEEKRLEEVRLNDERI